MISEDEMENIAVSRLQRVQEICDRSGSSHSEERGDNHNNIHPEALSNIYVDDRHHFLYCEVPKVACTNFKRILLILSGHMNVSDPSLLESGHVHGVFQQKYLTSLDEFSPEEISHKLKTYYKFMFVRNPFERLLSAYKNKFTMHYNTYFPTRYGKKIIKKYRRNPSKEALSRGHNVTFLEFIKYLIDPETPRSQPLNDHWKHYYKLCHPCVINYDFVGKYETLNRDVDYVLNQLNVSHLVQFPKQSPGVQFPKQSPAPTATRTADLVAQSYANISTEYVRRLWNTYAVDFAMFEYKYPDFLRKREH